MSAMLPHAVLSIIRIFTNLPLFLHILKQHIPGAKQTGMAAEKEAAEAATAVKSDMCNLCIEHT